MKAHWFKWLMFLERQSEDAGMFLQAAFWQSAMQKVFQLRSNATNVTDIKL